MAKVISPKDELVRFSYANVFTPKSINEGDKEKYSVSVIIPKTATKTLALIEKGIKLAIEEGKAKFGGKIPKNLKLPLRDGDDERPDDEAYEGAMFFNASSERKPQILGPDNIRIEDDPEEFYSGCYGRFSVNFYAFSVNGNKGIAAGLNNLQKKEDGERLSGSSSAADDFGDDDDDLL